MWLSLEITINLAFNLTQLILITVVFSLRWNVLARSSSNVNLIFDAPIFQKVPSLYSFNNFWIACQIRNPPWMHPPCIIELSGCGHGTRILEIPQDRKISKIRTKSRTRTRTRTPARKIFGSRTAQL